MEIALSRRVMAGLTPVFFLSAALSWVAAAWISRSDFTEA